MITAAGVLLMIAALGFAIRLMRGPSLADRIIAVDGILAVGCGGIALEALHSGDGEYIPTIVVITLIGFVSTAVAARFIEAQEDVVPDGGVDEEEPADGGSTGGDTPDDDGHDGAPDGSEHEGARDDGAAGEDGSDLPGEAT